MKPMFRVFALLLCLTMVLSACGAGSPAPSADASSASSDASASASQTSGPDAEAGPVYGPTGMEIGGGFAEQLAEKTDPTTLKVAFNQDSGNLDPQSNSLVVGIMIEKHIFDTLIIKDPVTGEFLPGLATEWEWVDDTHLKLTLREGVTFHNGSDFTSKDVLKTLERIQVGSASGSLYSTFDPASSSANGDYEVTIAFSSPFAPAVNYLTHHRAAVISADYLAENGEEANFQNPVGTGAYVFGTWLVGSSQTLTRNDSWWGLGLYGDCYFKNIEINFISDASARAIAVESGAVDLVCSIEAADFDAIFNGSTPHLLATKAPGLQVNYFAFNLEDPRVEFFHDQRVRLALAYAVDWPAVVEAAGGSLFSVAQSCLAPNVFGSQPQGTYEYNPERAKELLAEAGYPDGISFESTVYEGSTQRLWEILQSYWADVGIEMTFEVTDIATWVERLFNGNSQTSLQNMTAMTMDPAHALNQTVDHSAAVLGSLTDERYNELFDAALIELDEAKRAELYDELQAYIFETAWQIPMFVPEIPYAYWDYLEGVIPDPGQQLDMRILSLKTN